MIIKTTEELSDFTADQLKKSKLSQKSIAEKLGTSKSFISHAVSKGERGNSQRDGIRFKILNLLGYEVESVYKVKKSTGIKQQKQV